MKKLILMFSLIGTLTFTGCSNESDKVTDLPSSSANRTLPVQGFTFTCQADFMYVNSPGCYHVAVRVYMTDASGQTALVGQSEINVGDCSRVADGGDHGCLGEYNHDYITKDEYVGGQCIKELFRDNRNIYDLYVTAKNNAIAGH